MNDIDRRARLLALWMERPEDERTDTGIVNFYQWMEEHHPDLLRRGSGDPYQYLKADLTGYVN
jgi:hypothetical protein